MNTLGIIYLHVNYLLHQPKKNMKNMKNNLFARQLFITPTEEEYEEHDPGFTILSAPTCKADPSVDGTTSETFVVISLKERIILIGGTEYAGEIKKSIFSIMNYLLPKNNILSMHCSANVGEEGDVSL